MTPEQQSSSGFRLRMMICQTRRIGIATESCAPRGAEDMTQALQQELILRNLGPWVELQVGPCLGYCSRGPNMRLVGHQLYHGVTLGSLNDICSDIIAILAAQGITPSVPDLTEILPPI